jgi:NAD(P)-dependent dehydrogenase (short-subunit alcohol dehydrogenase family)
MAAPIAPRPNGEIAMKSPRPLAVVTGGAGLGVGSGVAKVLARDGWDLLVVDRDQELCSQLMAELETQTAITCLSIDLTEIDAPDRVALAVLASHGHLAGLVNNAGVGCVGQADTLSDEQFDQTLAVNLRAAFRLTRRLFPLLASARGAIVNLSSVHGRQPLAGFSVYAATKGAIEAMSRGWAVDFGPQGVRVNCVAPGMIDCPQTRRVTAEYVDDVDAYLEAWTKKRQLLPNLVRGADVGNLVAFLLGPRSNGITGQTIVMDAGTTLLLTDRDQP